MYFETAHAMRPTPPCGEHVTGIGGVLRQRVAEAKGAETEASTNAMKNVRKDAPDSGETDAENGP